MKHTIRMERFGRSHRRLVKDFSNQHASLERYIKRFALRHDEKDLLSRTWLAISGQGDHTRLAGFYSLAFVSVERAQVDSIESLARLPSFPIPGVLLAQLAVDRRVQGQGLGRFLFEEALAHALRIRHDVISCRLFVTDAIDTEAVGFYERFGLVRLSDGFPVRMVLDLQGLPRQHDPSGLG